MCGIVGCVGTLDVRSFLLDGLKKLDYRGYDSCGIAASIGDEVSLTKIAGKVESLAETLPLLKGATSGIGHTRWATHGMPNKTNAHPFKSMRGEFYLVHNGVISNYVALKNVLSVRGYVFESQTDSEIIADELERHYLRCGSVLEALRLTSEALEGSFACAIVHKGEPNRVYFLKETSPLLLGKGKCCHLVSSDIRSMIGYADSFAEIPDGTYGYIESGSAKVFKASEAVSLSYEERSAADYSSELGKYPHYMLKEIEETPSAISNIIANYTIAGGYAFNEDLIKDIKASPSVVLLGCGTSYHAALIGVRYLRYVGKRADAFLASEFAYEECVYPAGTMFILLSQSGETADLIKCQKSIEAQGHKNLVITNCKGSHLERNATYSCLLYSGIEVSVASTKTFAAQVSLLALLAGAVAGDTKCVTHLSAAIKSVEGVISDKNHIKTLADSISDDTRIFALGRGYDYLAALEGSLKVKEVANVDCTAYPGGELKHGPISLYDDTSTGICLVGDIVTAKAVRNNMEEASSRGAKSIYVSAEPLDKEGDSIVVSPVKPYLSCLPFAVAMQYIAYYLALKKGLSVDKPRNLAKSVTVE